MAARTIFKKPEELASLKKMVWDNLTSPAMDEKSYQAIKAYLTNQDAIAVHEKISKMGDQQGYLNVSQTVMIDRQQAKYDLVLASITDEAFNLFTRIRADAIGVFDETLFADIEEARKKLNDAPSPSKSSAKMSPVSRVS